VAEGAQCSLLGIRNDRCDVSSRELTAAPPRELAQRLSGGAEVLLLWYPADNSVELVLKDATTGTVFEIQVAPADAIRAFYHPYAYAAGRVAHRDSEHGAQLEDG
jgi:hypothetical protein